MTKEPVSCLVTACLIAVMNVSTTRAESWDLKGESWISPSKHSTAESRSVPAKEKPTSRDRLDKSSKEMGATQVSDVPGFSRLIESKQIAYTLRGLNNDVEMMLSLKNLTQKDLNVCVPQGVVFLPKSATVQRMLLRADMPYALPARKSVSKKIPVLCMDIAKSPPRGRDMEWAHTFDAERSALVAFTRKRAVAEARRRSDASQEQIEKFLLRFVIWRYNGATQKDFASFISKYGSPLEKMRASSRSAELVKMSDEIITSFRHSRKKGER